MATWIVHLRIAEHMLGVISGLQEDAFTLGNVAPDSGIPDENWEHFDPPPKVTHFQPEDNSLFRCADLDFFRAYLSPNTSLLGKEDFSIRLGYFFHLVTDNLWYLRVGKPAWERWRAQFSTDAKFWDEIKSDWYGLDHIYVRNHPESLFWRVFVKCAYQEDSLPFLPPQAVQHQLTHIQNYYRSNKQNVLGMLKRPFHHLNMSQVDGFVDEANRKLFDIYQKLWIDKIATDDCMSSLQLIDSIS